MINECVSWTKTKGCTALVNSCCMGCRFYTTAEQQSASLEKAQKRIASLARSHREYIQAKYYENEDVPWI